MKRVRLLMLLSACTILGCARPHFAAEGSLASTGNRRNTWRGTPEGCTRDPFDGLPIARSRTIATLIWEDPSAHDPKLDNHDTAPDAPLQMHLLRPANPASADPFIASIESRYQGGIALDRRVCTVLHLDTQENPAIAPALHPSLSGELTLDCNTPFSHISGHIRFDRCEY